MAWVDRSGNEEILDLPAAPYGNLRISPNGLRVATFLEDPANTDLYTIDFASGSSSRITFDPAADDALVELGDHGQISVQGHDGSTFGADRAAQT